MNGYVSPDLAHSQIVQNNPLIDSSIEIWFKDLSTIRKLIESESTIEKCPSCDMPFDKAKKRKLIDTCGHERCYSCMFRHDSCPQCIHSESDQIIDKVTYSSNNEETVILTNRDFHGSEITLCEENKTLDDQQKVYQKTEKKLLENKKANGHFSKSTKGQENRNSNGQLPITKCDKIDVMSKSFPNHGVPNNNSNKKRSFIRSPFSISSTNRSSRNNFRNSAIQENLCNYSESLMTTSASSIDTKNWSSVIFGKLKSLWSAGSSSTGLNQLTDEDNLVMKPRTKKSSSTDLYTRLNLLLDDNHKTQISKHSYNSLQNDFNQNTRISNSTSPMSTLTGSSEEQNYNHGNHGLQPMNICTGSIGSLASISLSENSNVSSSPLTNRRHSLTSSQHSQNDDLSFYKNRRGHSTRKPARSISPYDSQKFYVVSKARLQQLRLKPLFFEVPLHEHDTIFLGRHWLFNKVFDILETSNSNGVIISGNPGSGKTALILQIVEASCFGERNDIDLTATNDSNNLHTNTNVRLNMNHSYSSLHYQGGSQNIYTQPTNDDKLIELASRVIAYHFCQADNNETCIVADFIHSLSAQLCQAPQLISYREYVLNEIHVQNILSIKECIANPDIAFMEGILEPLIFLRKIGKLDLNQYVILIDALCEAEYHRPDYGETIITFLSKHKLEIPSFLKFILTIRTQFEELANGLNCLFINLNEINQNDNIQKDLQIYINYRMAQSSSLLSNTTSTTNNLNNGSNVKTKDDNGAHYSHYKFSQYLISNSHGSFLFVKLILDLLECGQLVVKSSNFKVLPVSLSQIFLLHFNLRFPTVKSYDKISTILSICLAALYPLTLIEIYYSLNALFIDQIVPWAEFLDYMKSLNGFLVKRLDNTFMFFHPSFREWLIRRDENESTKFLCDLRIGHASIAFRFSRLQIPLDAVKTLELGHHVLKAHVYRNMFFDFVSTRDLQTFWIATCSDNVSAAVCSLRNIYSPNVKVSRLLMLAGASPDYVTDFLGNAPILCMFSHEGIVPMVSLMLEFGANIHLTNSQGYTSLIFAASKGHYEVVKLLLSHDTILGQSDISGRCALVHAAQNGHLNIVCLLLDCEWKQTDVSISFQEATQQALVAASSQGHNDIVEYLLDNLNDIDSDIVDNLTDETALTAAASNGHQSVCCTLINRDTNLTSMNKKGMTPLLLAVKEGHWSIVELLLQSGVELNQYDSNGKSPLMIAAAEERLKIMELLLERGANIEEEDLDGLTSLGWACLRGRLKSVELLLENQADINHSDKTGRIPLDLAAFQGNPIVVETLINHGAMIEHVDFNGMRPLDRAIGCHNMQVVKYFLRKGAKLGPATWAMAAGKFEILLILLNKLLDDGNLLYKKSRLQEACLRFEYGLKKFPVEVPGDYCVTFQRLKIHFLLSESRCRRKLNELEEAVNLANQVLDLKSESYEAFYARAKAYIEGNLLELALADVKSALDVLSPHHANTKNFLLILHDNIVEKIQKRNHP